MSPGDRFGRLVLVQEVARLTPGGRWRCKCDCGNEKDVESSHLRSGKIQSCRCLQKERAAEAKRTHGMSQTRENANWFKMISRCHNPTDARYPLYGGRGIEVCSRWRESFVAFFADMGPRPSPKHSIDRVDNDRGYAPENCRWATHKEQCRNRRTCVMVTLDGVTRSATDWAELNGLPPSAVTKRLAKGIDPRVAVSAPLQSGRKFSCA